MLGAWLRELGTDVRRAWRRARRHPAPHGLAALTLALGIAASLGVFAVFDSVLVQRLPLPDSERLVWVGWTGDSPDAVVGPTPAEVATWRARVRSMSGVALYTERAVTFVETNRADLLLAAEVEGNFFRVLGATAERGRTLETGDDQAGSAPVAVISDALWRGRLAADPRIVGRVLHTDAGDAQIVGVMPSTFGLPEGHVDVWMSLFARQPYLTGSTSVHLAGAIGRLRPGHTVATAARELGDIISSESDKAQAPDAIPRVIPLRTFLTGGIAPLLAMVLAAAVALLLVACANVASLLFVQAADREREIAVQRALGAGRWRLIRQLMAESALLTSSAAATALLLVYVMMPALRRWAASQVPRSAEIALHGNSLGVTIVLAVLAALGVGLAPAFVTTARRSLLPGLTSARSRGSTGSRDPRAVVVAAEVGLALTLLIGAAVVARSVAQVVSASSGFATQHVATVSLMRPLNGYPADKGPTRRFADALTERLGHIRGVRAAAISLLQPTESWARGTARVVRGPVVDSTGVSFQVVTPEYFHVLEIPLVDGRKFDDRDGPTGEPTVIISARVAKRLFGSVHASGQRITARSNPPDSTAYQDYRVVGVVRDVSPPGPAREAIPFVYIPFAREPVPHMTILLQTARPLARVATAFRAVIAAMDPTQAISSFQSLDDVLAESTAAPRFYLAVLGAFAATALALATVGVYAVTLLGWRQRSRELGIRLALGASGADLVRLVMWQGSRPIIAGVAVGLGAAAAGTRVLRGLVSGVSVVDPIAFGGAALLLCVVAALAALVAARSVARGDPLQAIRSE